MSKAYFFDLEAPAEVATGTARNVEDYDQITIQFIGPFSADIDIEASLDGGSTWGQVGSTQSAPGVQELPGTYELLRLNTTDYTSGTPVVKVGARNSRGL